MGKLIGGIMVISGLAYLLFACIGLAIMWDSREARNVRAASEAQSRAWAVWDEHDRRENKSAEDRLSEARNELWGKVNTIALPLWIITEGVFIFAVVKTMRNKKE